MEYRIGNNKKIKATGETTELICPECNKKVIMSVYSNGKATLKADFPFFESEDVYFLVCPACASVFGVDEIKGKNFKKGEKLSIGNFDLNELKKFEV